jgi:membrane protein
VVDELLDVLPASEAGERDVERSIEEIATPLSVIALLWGGSGMMASIRVGLEAALKIERGRPAAHAKLFDFLLVGATGLLVLLVLGLSAFAAFFSRVMDWVSEQIGVEAALPGFLLRDGLQLVAIAVMALLLYRFVPVGRFSHRGAFAGAVLTALGIWGAAKLLAILLDFSRYNVIYGSLAGVMTFLVFVYVAALMLLLGAEFAYAWSQPPEPAPPLRTQIKRFLRGLVVHSEPETDVGEEPVRRR